MSTHLIGETMADSMDSRHKDNSLIERILECPRSLVLLQGAACSGKTTAAVGMYQRFVDTAGIAHCLLLGPNAPAVADLRRRVLSTSNRDILIRPQVSTFAALGRRILAAAGDRGRMLNPFGRRLLLRQIVDDLVESGALAIFRRISDTPGLIESVDRSIAELKRAAVEPEDLARAVGRSAGKAHDLLEVYRRYQQVLLDGEFYDLEGQMWKARDVLAAAVRADSPLPGLDDVTAVAVDGFTDFTPTQLEMLRLLCGRIRRGLITLSYCESGRERMWGWSHRTLNQIRRAFGSDLQEIRSEPHPTPLRGLWDKLFDFDATTCEPPETLQLIAAPDIDAEVAAAARRIKRILTSAPNTESVAVLARSLDEYRPAIERIFTAHDIPVTGAAVCLTDVPIVRFLLAVAGMAPDFTFGDVLRVIGSSYFRPQALGAFGAIDVVAAQMIIREGNVLANRSSYTEAARRLADRTESLSDDDDQPVTLGAVRVCSQTIFAAGKMLQKLFDLAESSSDAQGLTCLIDAMELRLAAIDGGKPEQIARDLQALAELETILADSHSSQASVEQLREALSAAWCSPPRTESLVDVLDVLEARALRYDHVFLLGLNDGGFPAKFNESAMITEGDRIRWKDHKIDLNHRGDLTAREMLLFYLAVSRADKSLTLSFLESDVAGSPTARSTFLLSVLDSFGGLKALEQCEKFTRIRPGSFIPPADQIACAVDAFNSAIAGLFDPALDEGSAWLGWVAKHAPQKIRRVAMGLLSRYRRYRYGECDSYDGRITDGELLKRLSQRYPAQNVFSAGQLNTYGQCPWAFFARDVLELAPLSEPQRRLEPVARGIFMHNVLFGVMRQLREEIGGAFRLGDVETDRLSEVLAGVVEAQSALVETRRCPYPALWKIQKDQMHQQIRRYLLKEHCRQSYPSEHLHFELGFGMDDIEPELLDPASRSEPITLKTPAGPVLMRGKIDRVDRISTDDGEGLLIVDYKSGSLPTGGDIAEGRNLQLSIYTEAAEQILSERSFGGAFHGLGDGSERHFSAVKLPRGGGNSFEQRREAALAKIGQFVAGMAAGRFDALPTHDCPHYCPYRQICHFSPARREIKKPSVEPTPGSAT